MNAPSTPPQTAAATPVPSSTHLVQLFLNTYEADTNHDDWDGPLTAQEWLRNNDMECEEIEITHEDLDRLRAFREALRDFVDCRADMPEAARTVLAAEMERCQLRLTFTGDRGRDVRLTPTGIGADSAIALLLAYVREAQLSGSWERLKVCKEHTCRWAFYDRSKNTSATWCSMAVCGNRNKARRYRSRASNAPSNG